MEYKEKNKDKKADPEKIKEYNRRYGCNYIFFTVKCPIF